MEASMNTSIDRGKTVTITPTTSQEIAQGEVLLLGTNLIAFALEKSAGATVRASQTDPVPARSTMCFEHEDVTIAKYNNLAIDVGDYVYWDVADNQVNKTASGNHLIGTCIEAAGATATTVRIAFDGARSPQLA